jgi:hypothetical protein
MTTTLQPRLLRNHRSLAKSLSQPRRLEGLSRAPAADHATPAALNNTIWSFQAEPAEDFFREMWSPGLLDRLQAPLSRYHE